MDPVSCPVTNIAFVAIKMGRRQGAMSGAYLNRYVTDEQRGRRPIFIATLRAVVSWLFFLRRGRSLRIHSDMLVARALKNSQLIRQRRTKAMLFMGQDTKIKSCQIGPPEAPPVFILFFDRQVKQ